MSQDGQIRYKSDWVYKGLPVVNDPKDCVPIFFSNNMLYKHNTVLLLVIDISLSLSDTNPPVFEQDEGNQPSSLALSYILK